MFQESKDLRAAHLAPSTHPSRRPRRRVVPLLIAGATVCTLVAFGFGVTAQTRAETQVVDLDARIVSLQRQLGEVLSEVDQLTDRAAEQRAQNDADRAALDSTDGFLE